MNKFKNKKQLLTMSKSEDNAMKSLISTIEIGGVKDALNILAKAGNEDSIEKAKHQIGDSHPKWPQLKWTDLGGGKFGWRTGTGRGRRASTSNAGNAGSGGSTGGNATASSQTSQAKPAKKETTDTTKTESTKKEDKKLRPVGTGTLGPTKREKDASKKTSTSVVKETSTVDEMINQAIGSIEGTTGRKLSYKEKDNIRTKVASYNIKVKSDWDISKEATEGLHVMLGDWKENEFKHDIENNSIEELQSKIAKQNKNIKDAQDRYESIHSQMKKYYGTMPPHSLNQSYTAVREQLALERCKKLHIENEIERRKKAAKILNDYVKGVK